jgi:hypothetical protein
MQLKVGRVIDLIASRLDRLSFGQTGEMELFVAMGTFQPIFVSLENSQTIVNATADNCSKVSA